MSAGADASECTTALPAAKATRSCLVQWGNSGTTACLTRLNCTEADSCWSLAMMSGKEVRRDTSGANDTCSAAPVEMCALGAEVEPDCSRDAG